MNGTQVLTVMRDHSRVRIAGGGAVCVCGEPFDAPILHTAHVADAIAAAFTGGQPVERPQRRCIPARELTHTYLQAQVRVPAEDDGQGTEVVEGRLAGLSSFSDVDEVVLVLWTDGRPNATGFRVAGGSWVEVLT